MHTRDGAYVSTSGTIAGFFNEGGPYTKKQFCNDINRCAVFMISTKSGRDISGLSDQKDEHEVLLRRGLAFKVVGKIAIPISASNWSPTTLLNDLEMRHWNAAKVVAALTSIQQNQRSKIMFFLQEVDSDLVGEVCKSKRNSFSGDVEDTW